MANVGGPFGNGNGNGSNFARFEQRVSWGNLLTIISFIVGLAAAWQNLATSLARVEEQLREEQRQRQMFQRDHDSLTKLESQVDELWKQKFPQGQ